jgi:ribosomal-protein-alanine N-acetyltransferase
MTPPKKPDIRTMTSADLNAVLAIEQASFGTPWNRAHFESEISGSYSFPYVVEQDGRVVGYVCLMSLFEEAQILDIAVDPARRGKGFAKALMQYAIIVAMDKGAEVLALEVRSSNAAAITLYERLGFVRVGLRSRYYDGVDDAVLMEKNLKETI